MVKTLAVSREMRFRPKLAVRARKAIGDQQMKSVNTNRAIRLAILRKIRKLSCVSKYCEYHITYFEFQATGKRNVGTIVTYY